MNDYNTYVAYRNNNAFTSERGAAKFLNSIMTTSSLGFGDNGGIINGFEVKALDTPAMSVKIAATETGEKLADGHCIINFDDYCYFGWLTTDYTLTITGSSQSASRISYIVAYIDRTITYVETDKIIESPSVLKFIEVPGTESTSPVAPTSAQIQSVVGVNNPYIILASISIPTSTSTITNANITDLRNYSKIDNDKINLDLSNEYTAGFEQANSSATKTRIVVTGPGDADPVAIQGVQLIWLKKKA